MDKLRTLKLFIAVSEKGSFVDAARTFGTSSSTISKAIARLEKDLEVQLFIRTTRAIKLTTAGKRYYLTSKRLLEDLENCEGELKQSSQEISGTLRINIPVSYGRLYIRPLLSSFCRKYPQLNVELLYDDAYIDIIERGIDVTFRSGTLVDNRLIAKKLSPIDFLICAPKGYFDHIDKPDQASLLHHRWVNFRFQQTGKIMPIFMNHEGKYKEYHPEDQLIVNDGEALAELCADGLGLAQMPHFIARNWILNGKIDALFPPYSSSGYGVFALYTKMKNPPVKISVFIEHIQQWLNNIGETPQRTWASALHH